MGILDNFTNIGKAVLIQALGIQQNYTTIIDSSVEVTDYSMITALLVNIKQLSNPSPAIMISTKWLLIIVTIVHIEFSQLRT